MLAIKKATQAQIALRLSVKDYLSLLGMKFMQEGLSTFFTCPMCSKERRTAYKNKTLCCYANRGWYCFSCQRSGSGVFTLASVNWCSFGYDEIIQKLFYMYKGLCMKYQEREVLFTNNM
jgi:hypothetical protein